MPTNLTHFVEKSIANKKRFRRFISKLESSSLDEVVEDVQAADEEVWKEIDCLSCANCCRKMAPTLNDADQKRIALYLNMSEHAFREKYLTYDAKTDDWSVLQQPCNFLDLATNKCTIYEIRPEDCAGFPHLTKMPLNDHMHIHKQNIMYCPATYLFVEKLIDRISFEEE